VNDILGNEDFINNIPLPNDASAMQNYTQIYQYDPLGNITNISHVAPLNPWSRDYCYNTNNPHAGASL
jgi:hypothetical protein